jgi:hypothetical protein
MDPLNHQRQRKLQLLCQARRLLQSNPIVGLLRSLL